MFKKIPVRSVVTLMILPSVIAACSPSATAQPTTPPPSLAGPASEKVDSVTCFNSETVVITKDGARFGLVPLMRGPVNSYDFYSSLREDGNFETISSWDESTINPDGSILARDPDGGLVIIPDGSTLDYNGNISINNVGGALIIVTDGVSEICVPTTTVVRLDGYFIGSLDSHTVREIHTCGIEAQTADRILLVFAYDRILLRKVEDRITFNTSHLNSTSDIHFYAERYEGEQPYQTDIRICYTGDTIGVELDEYPIRPGIWRYTSLEYFSYEIVDSNICNEIDSNLVNFTWFSDRWDETHSHVEYGLDEETRTLTVDLFRLVGPSSDIFHEFTFVNDLPPGKAVLVKRKDREGNVEEFPLVENCETYLSWIYQ